jgi:hypothetical protein
MRKQITAVLLGAALIGAAGTAFAQTAAPSSPTAGPVTRDSGEGRDSAYGTGGTAGTHPTGANVGPNRAQQQHSN